MATIRPMTHAEQNLLVDWAAREGWNPGLNDAELFWNLDPQGYLAIELDQKMIGGGAIIKHNDQFGFMGLFIVDVPYRGKKLGTELWYARRDHLLSRLKPNGTIGLDAVDAMIPFYAKGGFESFTRHRRFQWTADSPPASPTSSDEVVDLNTIPFDDLLALDAQCFPGSRASFLDAWIHQPDACALGIMRDGICQGFGVLRRCLVGYKIAPLFARTPDDAELLFNNLLSRAQNEPTTIDMPDNNPYTRQLVDRYRLAEVFGCVRMYLGPVPDLKNEMIYGITTLEVG